VARASAIRARAVAAPLLLVAALHAPFQCARRPPPDQRMEDDPAEVLYTLADKFKSEGNAAARVETLRFLVARYPTSRFAEAAKLDLGEAAPPSR
jgi:outer membrane protein assembly factor BamD (BamD/ComL family)